MHVVVVGLGSMGKRRIRLMLGNMQGISLAGVDLSSQRQQEASRRYKIPCFSTLAEASAYMPFDAGFVCTPPGSHYEVIFALLELGVHVFTELNLVNKGYHTLMKRANEIEKTLFLSSTMLYRSEIQHIRKQVSKQKQPLIYIYHVGQYLPDWHPWEDYRHFFVADVKTNGCRELCAIELPWILKTFGPVEYSTVSNKKISELEINYADSMLILLEHSNGTRGMLCIDLVSRDATRSLEVIGEHIHIKWEGTPDSLACYDLQTKHMRRIESFDKVSHVDGYADYIVENAYLDEIQCFFKTINYQGKPYYTFEDDLDTLALIERLEGGWS